jgi:hypothetical protein
MPIPVSSSNLRSWAYDCEMQSKNAFTSGDERDRLLRMRDALLALAKEQDWLSGKKSPPVDGGQDFVLAGSTG